MDENSLKISDSDGANLYEAIVKAGCVMPKGCGTSRCGACRVKIVSGKARIGVYEFSVGAVIKSCRAEIVGDEIVVGLPESSEISNIEVAFSVPRNMGKSGRTGIGLAMDIGSTTVALTAFKLENAEIVSTQTFTNPQIKFGEDVISRIAYAADKDGLMRLRRALLDDVEIALIKASLETAAEFFEELIVSGNTAMLHIFFGEDPSGLGKAPWTPAFLESKSAGGAELFRDAKVGVVKSLPCISAFVGADLSAACALLGYPDIEEDFLLVDIGTNAEMILKRGKNFYCTSAAAGPALEGWGLTSAVRAQSGAICAFETAGDSLTFKTIGGGDAKGICGSGYIDFLACARRLGIINSAGRFAKGAQGVEDGEGGKIFRVAPKVAVSEADIASLMKSKAAVCAGIKTLLAKFSCPIEMLDKIYIAGGFGKNINIQSAFDIGFIPECDKLNVEYLGNSSLGGAYLCALKPEALADLRGISSGFESVALNLEKGFEDEFIDALFLP